MNKHNTSSEHSMNLTPSNRACGSDYLSSLKAQDDEEDNYFKMGLISLNEQERISTYFSPIKDGALTR